MRGLLSKKFKKIISISLAFTICFFSLGFAPVSAHIDSDDEYFIYGGSVQEGENELIDSLYDMVNCFFRCERLEHDGETFRAMVVPNFVKRFVFNGGTPVEPAERKTCVERCVRVFTTLLQILNKGNFDEKNFMNICRCIAVSSVLCITYSAKYVHLLGHITYVLNCFREHSPIIDKLIRDDDETWAFVLEHIHPYNANELLTTAEELCACTF